MWFQARAIGGFVGTRQSIFVYYMESEKFLEEFSYYQLFKKGYAVA